MHQTNGILIFFQRISMGSFSHKNVYSGTQNKIQKLFFLSQKKRKEFQQKYSFLGFKGRNFVVLFNDICIQKYLFEYYDFCAHWKVKILKNFHLKNSFLIDFEEKNFKAKKSLRQSGFFSFLQEKRRFLRAN